MANNYYYLVAGLPDITLENNKLVPTVGSFLDEIGEQVTPEDAALVKLLRAPFDNANCVNVLEQRERPFDDRGTIAQDQLADALKNGESIPGYMQELLEARREGKMPLGPEMSTEDQLAWLFYDRVTGHSNEFIRQWFEFDRDLRNVLAACTVRQQAANQGGRAADALAGRLIGHTDVNEQLLKSSAPDFGVAPVFPWIETVLQAVEADPVERERRIDQLRWNVLDEMTVFTYFSIETILAFSLKLFMVDRWMKLDPETGKQRLTALVDELKSGFHLSEEFA